MMLHQDPAYIRLRSILEAYGKLAVAFSGGVDSSFLLAAAKDVLADQLIGYTVKTVYMSQQETEEAVAFAIKHQIRHHIIQVDFPAAIRENPENRCYLCKKNIFNLLLQEAATDGYAVLADGTNHDDSKLHRPGMKALQELGIRSPLRDAGLSKDDIRRLSALMGLSTANKPARACLLTRLPHNTVVKEEYLNRIEKAESFLYNLGNADARVRTHGSIARIEADPSCFTGIVQPEVSAKICRYFKEIGYTFVTLDLEGYRTGTMDFPQEEK